MWLTKEMIEDIDNKITWNPRPSNWLETLEEINDALAVAGYGMQITKFS